MLRELRQEPANKAGQAVFRFHKPPISLPLAWFLFYLTSIISSEIQLCPILILTYASAFVHLFILHFLLTRAKETTGWPGLCTLSILQYHESWKLFKLSHGRDEYSSSIKLLKRSKLWNMHSNLKIKSKNFMQMT